MPANYEEHCRTLAAARYAVRRTRLRPHEDQWRHFRWVGVLWNRHPYRIGSPERLTDDITGAQQAYPSLLSDRAVHFLSGN